MRPLKDKRDREETLRESEQASDRQEQTEIDTLSELPIGHCACDHAKNTSSIKERDREREREIKRETESKTARHTYGERNMDKAQGRNRERQRGKDR